MEQTGVVMIHVAFSIGCPVPVVTHQFVQPSIDRHPLLIANSSRRLHTRCPLIACAPREHEAASQPVNTTATPDESTIIGLADTTSGTSQLDDVSVPSSEATWTAAADLPTWLPVPGPRPLPMVGNALDVIGVPISELMLSYARKYGPFLKFSIVNDVMHLVSDPVALQHIHVTNSRNYLDRWTPPGFGPLLYDGRLRGLVFSQGRYWMQHRQLVSSVFRSRAFLSHFVSVASNHVAYLIDNVWGLPLTTDREITSQRKATSTVVNVYQAMRMLTLDVIGTAAFGTSFGAMQAGGHSIEKSLASILHGVLDVIKSPLPLWRFTRTPGRARIDDSLRQLQAIELDLIHQRRASLTQSSGTNGLSDGDSHGTQLSEEDLLATLLRARDSARGDYFQDEDLIWDVHDVIFAGHETTSSALAAALWLIAGSPRVLRKIRAELDLVLEDGRAPNIEDLGNLVYLDMTFNEALRLYPPTALVGRIAKEADVIGCYEVPAGANVLVSPYVMGRLSQLWGDDVEEFRPERFDPEANTKRHPMSHTPFGAGPRVCLGARMATMQAKVVLATLLRRVDFDRLHDTLDVDYDSTVSFKHGMDMRIQRNDCSERKFNS